MGEPYLSEIRMMSFSFPPRGWALCNGQLLSLQQNQVLFSLVGTKFGGNGTTNFGLPNLQGRVPIHTGLGHTLAEAGGEASHVLTTNEIPSHTHQAVASSTTAGLDTPSEGLLGGSAPNALYGAATGTLEAMKSATISNGGGGQPHQNMQPFLTVSFCIALTGIFPSQT
jgi:microcystin-dependent protein